MNDDAQQFLDDEWAAEIDRRAAEARRNPNDGEDWRIVLDEIERDLFSRKPEPEGGGTARPEA